MTTALLIVAGLAFIAALFIIVWRAVINHLYKRLYDEEKHNETSP